MNRTSIHTAYIEGIEEIEISDDVTTDISEYGSYEEAIATAEMLSLHNVKAAEHEGKYKLVSCSKAMDFSGELLAVGDKVHYSLYGTWEIVDISMDSVYHIMNIQLKFGNCTECVSEYINKDGQYVFKNLKLEKINARYIRWFISDGSGEFLGKYDNLILGLIGFVAFPAALITVAIMKALGYIT